MKLLIPLFLISVLSACSFNKSFYYPDTKKVNTPPDAESIYIHYGEQDSIHSVLFKRRNPSASIFILHGNAGSLNSWSEVADLFYQANYQVFIIDYPGFGNSSGQAKHKAVFEATNAAVEYFDCSAATAKTKKLLLGFSLGGNLAIKVGHDHPDVFDAMLIEGAFESHKAAAVDKIGRPLKILPRLFVKNHIKGKELIQKWDKPLLIVHSKDDAVCDYKMGKELYNNAIGTDQKELWSINGPHLSGLSKNFGLYMAKINAMIDKIETPKF